MMNNIKRVFGLLIALSLLGSSLFVPSQTAHAATTIPVIDLRAYLDRGGASDILGVNGTCTLRKAIIAINTHKSYDACAADATTSTILLPNTTIYLTVQNKEGVEDALKGDLNITSSMTIMGTGPNSAVGWYANPNWPDPQNPNAVRSEDRVFNIQGAVKVSMSGFKIINGTTTADGGGIWNYGGDLTLQNMTIDNNRASNWAGGGVASYGPGSKLSMSVVNVTNNYSGYRGGGVYTESTTQIENSYFYNNFALQSGAGIDYNNSASTIAGLVSNSTFSANAGQGISNSGNLVLSYLTMVRNVSFAVQLNAGSWTVLRDSILYDNNYTSPGKDCFMNGGNFVDGGYNIVYPNPSAGACPYNNGDATTYHTQIADPKLLLDQLGPQGNNLTSVYPFTREDGTGYNVAYNNHPMDGSGGCVTPSLSGFGLTFAVPALPGNDQYLGRRPTYLEADPQKGCDTGAYELNAYLSRPKTYIPSIFSK